MRGKQAFKILLGLALCGPAGCGPDDGDSGGIRLLGLVNAPCTSATKALFGSVPVLVEPTGERPLRSVSVSANDGAAVTSTKPPFSVQLDTTKLKDGTARVAATATDDEGESLSASVQVCVDNSGPLLNVLAPADGAAVGLEDAELKVRVRASDPAGVDTVVAHASVGGIVQRVSCKPPGAKELDCTLKPGELGLTLTPKSISELTLTITARDKWGREAQALRKLKVSTRLLWSYYTGGSISWAAVPLKSGNVVVGNDSGAVHVVSSSGTKVCTWTAPPMSGKAEGIATPITDGGAGTLFFASTQRVYGFNAATCVPTWSVTKGLYFASQPAYDATAGVVYIGSYGSLSTNGSLLGLSAVDGKDVSSFGIAAVNETVTGAPALSADGKTVYIGSSDFKLYAVNVSAAPYTQRWVYTTGAKIESRPLVSATRILLGGMDKVMHAIDPVTGNKDPAFNFTAQAGFFSAPVLGQGGVLYAGSLDLNLYALDSAGKVKAKYDTGRIMRSSPAIGPGGVVFAAKTQPGRLYALSPDLKLLWSIKPSPSDSDKSMGSPAVSGNTVYIGSTNGYLYALDATPPSS